MMENGIQISSINKQLSNEDQHFGKKAASKNKENTSKDQFMDNG